jgi:hypothetical protein
LIHPERPMTTREDALTMIEDRDPDARTGMIRLGVGLAQGLAAAALIEGANSFGKANPQLFAALAIVVAFPPLILLGGLGRMRPRSLLLWTLAAAAVLAGLAAYDLWRQPFEAYADRARVWPGPQFLLFTAVGVFIAHHLIEPADVERRLFASYGERFETASRHAFQLVLSALFTLVFWGVLHLGAGLFDLIGVKVLSSLLREAWFTAPLTACAFAAAVHLTDVRPGLIRGVRAIGLTLLSWLLPLMAGLTLAFLVALVFTGVEPLWATRRAAALMLSAAAVLIVLVNAVYQDGDALAERPAALRWSVRGAALLLIPLVALAGWANALRIQQYGLTPERVVALFVLAVAAVFALGYAWAAVARGPWMRRLSAVNVAAAVAALAAILAAFSPLADPARLSVADQLRRLETGRTRADAFDFRFLRHGGGRFGRDALTRLSRSSDPAVAQRARRALQPDARFDGADAIEPPFSKATVLPAGAVLPESFRRQAFTRADVGGSSACLIGGAACTMRLLDVTGDGAAEVLVEGGPDIEVFARSAEGRWSRLGRYGGCPRDSGPRIAAPLRSLPSQALDLEIEGRRTPFQGEMDCGPARGPQPPPDTRPPPEGMGPAFNRP